MLIYTLCIILIYAKVCHSKVTVNLNSKRVIHEDKSSIKIMSFCVDCPSPQLEGMIVNSLIAKHSIQEFDVTGDLVYCIPNYADQPLLLNKMDFKDRFVMVDRGKVSLLKKVENIVGITTSGDGKKHVSNVYGTSKSSSESKPIPKLPNDKIDVSLNKYQSHIERQMDIIKRQKIHIQKDHGVHAASDIIDALPCAIIIVDDKECDADFKYCGYRTGSVSTDGFAPYDIVEHWYNIDMPVVMITYESGQILKTLLDVVETEVPGYGQQFVVSSTSEASGLKIKPKRNIDINPIVQSSPYAQIVTQEVNKFKDKKSNSKPNRLLKFNQHERVTDMSRRDLLDRGTWKNQNIMHPLKQEVEMDISGLENLPPKPSDTSDPYSSNSETNSKRSLQSSVSHSITKARASIVNKLFDKKAQNERRV